MKKCRYCKKEIEEKARRCDKCGSYQIRMGIFLNLGIPVISILLALVSWSQTYIETMAKNKAVAEKQRAETLTRQTVVEKQEMEIHNEELQQKIVRYDESLIQIEAEVKSLKAMNVPSGEYRRKLNSINKKIELTREPEKIIDGIRYRKIE